MIETPGSFAARFPRLWRLAERGSHQGIRRHGLLTAAQAAQRAGHVLSDVPRRESIWVGLPDGTPVRITDNTPLSFGKLGPALDDMAPAEWLAMLNDRVFFWPARTLGEGNLKARRRYGYDSEWQEYETLGLLASCWDRAEVAHINTGSTIHQPARRGRQTFAPLAGLDFEAWRRRRRDAGEIAGLDTPKEVTVRGGVSEAGRFLLNVLPCD